MVLLRNKKIDMYAYGSFLGSWAKQIPTELLDYEFELFVYEKPLNGYFSKHPRSRLGWHCLLR